MVPRRGVSQTERPWYLRRGDSALYDAGLVCRACVQDNKNEAFRDELRDCVVMPEIIFELRLSVMIALKASDFQKNEARDAGV